MYNLILVDDEPVVLQGIQKVFKLEDFGFTLIRTYTNPLLALEELKETMPDLIITDVKMPQMDGICFSSEVKKILPETQIVILSGHDNFSYAQAAMRAGAGDYLLKPIKKKDFEAMLEHVRQRLALRDERLHQAEQVEKTARLNYSILRNRFFQGLLSEGSLEKGSLRILYDQLGFHFEHSAFVLIKFVIYEISTRDDYMSAVEKIISQVEEHFLPEASVEEFYTDEYLYFFVYDFKNVVLSEEALDQWLEAYTMDRKKSGIRLLTGISDVYHGISNILKAAMECDEGILAAGDARETNKTAIESLYTHSDQIRIPYKEIDDLFDGIFAHDMEKIENVLKKIYELPAVTLFRDFGLSITLLILMRMCHMQNKYRHSLDHPGTAFITPEMISIAYLSAHLSGAGAMREFILDRARRLSDLVRDQEENAPSKMIRSALEYINSHFNENISLSQVAGKIFISKNYLCDLFKKELNVTFIDYVTDLRVEKAKELLRSSGMKMYEISEAVGYNDYAYFSQIFKRHTGTTLSDYRRRKC